MLDNAMITSWALPLLTRRRSSARVSLSRNFNLDFAWAMKVAWNKIFFAPSKGLHQRTIVQPRSPKEVNYQAILEMAWIGNAYQTRLQAFFYCPTLSYTTYVLRRYIDSWPRVSSGMVAKKSLRCISYSILPRYIYHDCTFPRECEC